MPPRRDRTSAKQIEHAEKRYQALQLRKAGASYRDIARQMEVSTATAFYWVEQEMKAVPAEDAVTLRQQEVERLDRLQQAVWTNALKGDVPSVNTAVGIIDRRAKLLGLDAPQQVQVGVANVDISGTAERILKAVESGGIVDAEVVEGTFDEDGNDT